MKTYVYCLDNQLIELAFFSVQDDKDTENLESGEETFFPALCVGTKKTSAVVTFLSFCPCTFILEIVSLCLFQIEWLFNFWV